MSVATRSLAIPQIRDIGVIADRQPDPLGLSQLDYIGADRCMWATDYPHSEGAFGYGRTSVRAVVDTASPDDARAILGGNAIDVFQLDR